jgi:hypothetical protein
VPAAPATRHQPALQVPDRDERPLHVHPPKPAPQVLAFYGKLLAIDRTSRTHFLLYPLGHALNSNNDILTNDISCPNMALSDAKGGISMRKGSTLFLKVVLVLIALGAFVGMIRFPQLEGRAASLDIIGIYSDPFIIYGYIASIPFFVALYQAFKLLGYIEQNRAFSQTAVQALRKIQYCAIAIIGFIALGVAYIRFSSGGDDPAGAVAMGMLSAFVAVVIATAAAVFQKLLQSAVDIKSENDLTV